MLLLQRPMAHEFLFKLQKSEDRPKWKRPISSKYNYPIHYPTKTYSSLFLALHNSTQILCIIFAELLNFLFVMILWSTTTRRQGRTNEHKIQKKSISVICCVVLYKKLIRETISLCECVLFSFIVDSVIKVQRKFFFIVK